MVSSPNQTGLTIDYQELRNHSAVSFGAGALLVLENLRRAEFVSDGTNWRARSGRQTLYRRNGTLTAPVATLTGTGAVQNFVLPETLIIPRKLLAPHSAVFMEVWARRTGTAASFSSLISLGTLNTTSDNSLVSQTIDTTANREVHFYGAAKFGTSLTSFVSDGFGGLNGVTSSSQADRTTNINTDRDMYLNIGVNTAFIAPDTFAVNSYHVWIES